MVTSGRAHGLLVTMMERSSKREPLVTMLEAMAETLNTPKKLAKSIKADQCKPFLTLQI